MVSIWHQGAGRSFLNMDFDDDNPALSMDVALSACDDRKPSSCSRQLLPVPGHVADPAAGGIRTAGSHRQGESPPCRHQMTTPMKKEGGERHGLQLEVPHQG